MRAQKSAIMAAPIPWLCRWESTATGPRCQCGSGGVAARPLADPGQHACRRTDPVAEDDRREHAQLLKRAGLTAAGRRHAAHPDHRDAAEGTEDRASPVQTAQYRPEEARQRCAAALRIQPERADVDGIVAHGAAEEVGRLSQLATVQLA
jgi:hypothetical protein